MGTFDEDDGESGRCATERHALRQARVSVSSVAGEALPALCFLGSFAVAEMPGWREGVMSARRP